MQPRCVVSEGHRHCQLSIMPNRKRCWYHLNNVGFPEIELADERVREFRFTLPNLKHNLVKKQWGCCCICGEPFEKKDMVELEHPHPVALGGNNDFLGAAHSQCNMRKNGMPIWDPRIRESIGRIKKHKKTAKRLLNKKQEKEVCAMYLKGATLEEVASEFHTSVMPIKDALARNKCKRRTRSEASPGKRMTKKQRRELCKRYMAGEGSHKLGKEFGFSRGRILETVRRNGHATRSVSQSRRKLTDKQEKKLVSMYAKGASSTELARKFGVCHQTALYIARKHGQEIRSNSEAQKVRYIR